CLTVLAGCSISLVESASSPRTQPPPAFAKRLRPLLEAKMKELQIPGATVFVDLPGQGSWTTTLGTSNLKTGIPMNPNSYVRVGSLTKTWTATVILQLVDAG